MKKILYLLLTLTFIACSNDSVSDIAAEPDTNETPEENNTGGDGENNSTKVTFTTDILPIINNNCSSCHTGGAQTNYTIYSLAKNNADLIKNRINRNQGSGGFMPQNGTKLSSAELAKFDQWITDGKLE